RTPHLARPARGESRRYRGHGNQPNRRSGARTMRPAANSGGRSDQQKNEKPLVSLAEIAEIELFILKRMKEYTLGDHNSVFKGVGFNFVGLRDWEPGDRMSSIDWPQSSLNNFSPIIIREFEQNSTGTVFAVADASLSTRCGMGGLAIATAIARSIAAVGLSA